MRRRHNPPRRVVEKRTARGRRNREWDYGVYKQALGRTGWEALGDCWPGEWTGRGYWNALLSRPYGGARKV